MQCIAMHCNANQRGSFENPIPIEFVMSTGRYTRIHTRWLSDPLFPPHPSRNAFAIAFTHTMIYTQQDSIHRFAESWDGSNLHSTPLHFHFQLHQCVLQSTHSSEVLRVTFPFRIANSALHHYIISSNPPSTLHPSTLITTPSLFSPLFTFLDLRK